MPTLNWRTREADLKAAAAAEYRLLVEEPALSYGDPDAGNLVVQGDNLEALKALLPFYAGQVKCIYIDPPYNTGSAFEHYDDNLEHSRWLSLIYPRLELLRQFLAEDGSIWMSIDDDEGHYLKVICDEVFGRNNFINTVIWQKKFSPQNDAKWLSDNHDFILAYAKNKEIWKPNLLPRTDEMDARYKNPDNDPRGVWSSSDLTAQEPLEYGQYEIVSPTGKVYLPGNNRHWIYAKEKYLDFVKDNRIWFGDSGNNKPRLKKFLTEVQQGSVSLTVWLHTEVGHNQDAKKEVIAINADDIFSTPKPERLLQRIIHIATSPGDLVLDSFLGSGTTAAVAHKMGRKYIGIEMGEQAKTHCAARLIKVIDGEQGGISKAVNWKGGGGFRFFSLGEAVFDSERRIKDNISFEHLAAHIWFTETKTPMSKQLSEQLSVVSSQLSEQLSVASSQLSEQLSVVSSQLSVGSGLNMNSSVDGNVSADISSEKPITDNRKLTTEAKLTTDNRRPTTEQTPFLGVHNGTAYALLYNGILGDKTESGGNILTHNTLNRIMHEIDAAEKKNGAEFEYNRLVIYGEATRLPNVSLKQNNIEFKQTPYDIKVW